MTDDENAGKRLTPSKGGSPSQKADGDPQSTIIGLTMPIVEKALGAVEAGVGAIGKITEAIDRSGSDAQATAKAAIESQSATFETLAANMESDDARLKLAEMELEREREKTKQAEIGERVHKRQSAKLREALRAIPYIVVGVVGGTLTLIARQK